jgi:hypothetical protein
MEANCVMAYRANQEAAEGLCNRHIPHPRPAAARTVIERLQLYECCFNNRYLYDRVYRVFYSACIAAWNIHIVLYCR